MFGASIFVCKKKEPSADTWRSPLHHFPAVSSTSLTYQSSKRSHAGLVSNGQPIVEHGGCGDGRAGVLSYGTGALLGVDKKSTWGRAAAAEAIV